MGVARYCKKGRARAPNLIESEFDFNSDAKSSCKQPPPNHSPFSSSSVSAGNGQPNMALAKVALGVGVGVVVVC